ncbi:MAG: beta-propeller domain-containing protein [Candidatus Bathyarchaeota archaeon]|nr:beta-propeller domain-containing protein [Candidatus Bathyarchaeota archaeon]
MVQKEVKKKTSIYAIIAIFSAILLVSMVYTLGSSPNLQDSSTLTSSPLPSSTNPPEGWGMRPFSSIDELKTYLINNTQQSYWLTAGGTYAANSALAPEAQRAGGEDYSTTNIQVAGVDEADTVKTDGKYIYTISSIQNIGYYYSNSYYPQTSNNVYIINADPQNARVIAKITLDNDTTPVGLFLSQDSNRLIVIASRYQYSTTVDPRASLTIMPYWSYQSTAIYGYDISNKAAPVLARNLTVTGSYFNSRMIGNYLYAVVSQDAYVYNDIVPLPAIYEDGRMQGSQATSIYYADMNQSTYFSFTSFYGINVLDDQQSPTNMTVLMSGASTMYVSLGNIYVAYPNWANGNSFTSIYRVKIDGLNLRFEAQGSVPGYTINQYAMDEYDGNLRIATNLYQYTDKSFATATQTNNVYVLNQNLTIIGKLEGLAKGENLHAARFMGNRGYLVTFKKTDPLFAIDLSQPTNPKVLGELKIPGYSDYLHPYDETHLIGLGKEAVEAQEGDFAWYQGLKLALFDVSDVNKPTHISSVTIGDRGTDSTALYEPKAFLFDKSKNLLVIPVTLAVVPESQKQQGASAYGEMVWQGACIFSVTDTGLSLRGNVTHLDTSAISSSSAFFNQQSLIWDQQKNFIVRSLYIGNTLYTISNAQVKLNNLADLSEIATVKLN